MLVLVLIKRPSYFGMGSVVRGLLFVDGSCVQLATWLPGLAGKSLSVLACFFGEVIFGKLCLMLHAQPL